jgi:tRNA A64-2'-O-ribosylphosphate transferase
MFSLILVDSTRAGKQIPDAFSKTVPIWCAVINRAIAQVSPPTISEDWDIALYSPPQVVSDQEHAQIEARLDGWANALVVRP